MKMIFPPKLVAWLQLPDEVMDTLNSCLDSRQLKSSPGIWNVLTRFKAGVSHFLMLSPSLWISTPQATEKALLAEISVTQAVLEHVVRIQIPRSGPALLDQNTSRGPFLPRQHPRHRIQS